MSRKDDEDMGRWIERLAISDWLRSRTHLIALADLLEQGVHKLSDAEQEALCKKHGIDLRARVES